MSAESRDLNVSGAGGLGRDLDWGLIRRQVAGLLRLELRSSLFTGKSLAVYFLAFAPVLLVATWAFTPLPEEMARGPMDMARAFGYSFVPYVGTSIFLSCLMIFMSLFRSEILEKTLHYHYLAPVRREVIVVAKYLTGLISVVGVYVVGTALFFLFMILPWGVGEMSRFLFDGPGLSHLLTYVGIAVLACIGYGALFLLSGLLVRNPVVVAVIVWAWEGSNAVLPAALKKISIVHYLKSLLPVPLRAGPFAVFAEPTPAWIAVPGLLLVSLGFLALACWRARTMEITYGGED